MPGHNETARLERLQQETAGLHTLCNEQRAEINNLHLIIADALTCLLDDGHYLARIQKARQVLGQAERIRGDHA